MRRTSVPGCNVVVAAALGSAEGRAGAPEPPTRWVACHPGAALWRSWIARCTGFAGAGRRAGRSAVPAATAPAAGITGAPGGAAAGGAAGGAPGAAGGAAPGGGGTMGGAAGGASDRADAAAGGRCCGRDLERHGGVSCRGRCRRRPTRRRLLHLLHRVERRLARRDASTGAVGGEELTGDGGEVVAFGCRLRGGSDEVLRRQLEHDAVGERADRRGAGAALEDRDLAERVALGVLPELALAAAGLGLHRLRAAALEQVERGRSVALAGDRGPGRHLALVELAREVLLLLEVEAAERALHVAARLTPEQLGRAERRGRRPPSVQVRREDLRDDHDHEADDQREDDHGQEHLQGRRAHVEDVEIDRQRHAVSPG